MISLTIDGKTVHVPEGTTVLRAAESAGVFIPTLCDHKELIPYGGCRLCLVEIDGMRGLQPSCTMPASNNMVINTDTERIHAARKFVLTMLFSERNHFCPFCVVTNGDCELQNAAYGEGMTHWPLQPNWKPYTVDASHPYFVLDHNRCILCRRCVRACGELVGNFTLGFEERGAACLLVADTGTPLGKSSCISCGNCVQVCPTGALIDRVSAYRGREIQVEHNKTVCAGCSVGCSVDILTRDNTILRIEGAWEGIVNKGIICKVGRFIPLNEERERIHTPLVKKDGKLKAATWDEALEVIAKGMKPLMGKKNLGVAALISTRLSAEVMFQFKELFAESDMVTSSEEGVPTATAAMTADEIGKPFEGRLDVLNSTDCVVVFGADLVNKHEVAGFMLKRILPKGVNLIIVDPDDNTLDAMADVTIKPKKESYSDVFRGLTAALVKIGKSKSPTKVLVSALEKSSHTTNIRSDEFVETAKIIANADKPVFIYGKGVTANGGPEAVKALIDLANVAGVISDNHSSLINVKGKANSLAAAQYHLDTPFVINGHQAAYIALGDDEPSQRLLQSIKKAPFVVVQASFVSQASALADVVLPVENWMEQEGHFVNLEGRLQNASKAINAPEDVWSNEAVIKAVAAKLGVKVNSEGWKNQLTQRVPSVTISES
jgi:formate dehydrogenase major subunit